MENPRLYQVFVVDAVTLNQFRMEQIDPFSVRCVRYLTGIATVATEERTIPCHIEMNGPFVARQVVPSALSISQSITGEPEILAFRGLQVVPDGLSVGTPKLMPSNLHGHRAVVDQHILRSVSVDGPDAIDLVPRALVTVHQQARVRGRKEQMVHPIGAMEQRLHLAGFEINGEED